MIVDKYSSTRALLKNFLRAEISDCRIHEAVSLEEGLSFFNPMDIQLAILSDRLSELEHAGRHRDIPPVVQRFANKVACLVILSLHQPQHMSGLQTMGFRHFLPNPYTANQLAEMVEQVAPARRLRNQPRFHLPHTTAHLHLGEHTLHALVVNVSPSGVLCEVAVTADKPPVFSFNDMSQLAISLHLPAALNIPVLERLACRLVGMKILEWHENNLPALLRLEVKLLTEMVHNFAQLSHTLLLMEE
ncbi:MAG: hypothetical protein HQL55_01070 [Magnetococcales bacterium]|nr:hypothetical protein [Magnetococcales bacterium]